MKALAPRTYGLPNPKTLAGHLVSTGVAALLIAMLAFHYMTRQPWLGARFIPSKDGNGIVVSKVHAGGPGDGVLQQGLRLVAISDGDTTVSLDPLILAKPGSLSGHARFNRSLRLQDEIWSILTRPQIQLQTVDGGWRTIRPRPARPLSAIPAVYWLYPAMASIGALLSVLILARKPPTIQAIPVLILGCSYYLGMCESMSIDRELALPQAHLRFLLTFGNFAANVFLVSILCIFLTYPARIVPRKSIVLCYLAALIFPLNSAFQGIEMPVHAYQFHLPIIFAAIVAALGLQWRHSRSEPVNRAQLLWAMLWMAMPTLAGLLVFLAPVGSAYPPALPVESARLFMSPFVIGLAFGAFRYRLFDAEKWWSIGLFWIMGGALVIVFDMLFVRFLDLQPASAMTPSLVIAGLVYFPVRKRLLALVRPERQGSVESRITKVIEDLGANGGNKFSGVDWGALLKKYFNPVEMEPLADPVRETHLSGSGLTLTVPGRAGHHGYAITGKHFGKSLFNNEDIQQANALQNLSEMVDEANNAAEVAAKAERQRIMQDLHDTMGAQLLTLIHRSSREEYTQDVRGALQNLRESVRILSNNQPVSLSELLADWRIELREQANAQGFRLDWPNTDRPNENIEIAPREALPIACITRGLLLEIPPSLDPSAVLVRLTQLDQALYLLVTVRSPRKTRRKFLKSLSSLRQLQKQADALGHKLLIIQDSTLNTEHFRLIALLKLLIRGRNAVE